MATRRRARSESGQASPEWVALVLLAALLFAALIALVGPKVPGATLARMIANKILCSALLSDACGPDLPLVLSYGERTAELLREHAPEIAYEDGMRALPVDFRGCRATECADGAEEGRVLRSHTGSPVAAFVRVIDCGRSEAPTGIDCSGDRGGRLYLQYWLYYPNSATLRGVPYVGPRGYHEDDWESYMVRIGPEGDAEARASSHHGYNYEGGARNWASDAGLGFVNGLVEEVGLRRTSGWGPETGWLFVSGGSHAGAAAGSPDDYSRQTPGDRVRLIPLEQVAGSRAAEALFAISPPWVKNVYSDPEAEGTD